VKNERWQGVLAGGVMLAFGISLLGPGAWFLDTNLTCKNVNGPFVECPYSAEGAALTAVGAGFAFAGLVSMFWAIGTSEAVTVYGAKRVR
jgi:hypothetical protein